MSRIGEIDSIIRASLESLAQELKGGKWRGQREREVVSLFCFGHLIGHCRPKSVLHDPAQISMEVPVPQIEGQRELTGKVGRKSQVCKDIVIWPNPRMVVWDDRGQATVRPSSVIEWKHNKSKVDGYDTSWLGKFSELHPEFVGYAVCTRLPAVAFTLSCTRIVGGKPEPWLCITLGTQTPPNTRVQRTRSSASPRSSPLTRRPLGGRNRLERLIPRLTIAAAVLTSLGPAVGYAQQVQADACEAQLPSDLKRFVSTRFPNYRTPLVTDNELDDVKWNLDAGWSGCVGVAIGDFDGSGQTDYALLMMPRNDGPGMLVVGLRVRGKWSFRVLEKFEARERSRHFVSTEGPGKHSRAESLEGDLGPDERESLTSRTACLRTGWIESASRVFCRLSSGWVYVVDSD